MCNGVQMNRSAFTTSAGKIYVVLIANHLQPTLDQFAHRDFVSIIKCEQV